MLLIPIEETKQHVSIMFTLKPHQVIMGVQLPEIQSLSLFLGSGFLLIWGFSSRKSSRWVCSWAQGFSWHGGLAPGNLVVEFVLGFRVSPDTGLMSRSRWDCLSPVAQESCVETALHSLDGRVGVNQWVTLQWNVDGVSKTSSILRANRFKILTGKQIKPGPPNSSFLALFDLFWQLTNCW